MSVRVFLQYHIVLSERKEKYFVYVLLLPFPDHHASETCQLWFYRECHSGSEVLYIVQTVRRTAQ